MQPEYPVSGCLNVDSDGAPSGRDLKVIVTSILWQVAQADGHLDRLEYLKIVETLKIEFKLSPEAATELVNLAAVDARHPRSSGREEHFQELRGRYSLEQRRHLYEAVWNIVKADFRLDSREVDFVATLARKLEISGNLNIA
jgi:uncharacterized tellurite resistance protein B-like protein